MLAERIVHQEDCRMHRRQGHERRIMFPTDEVYGASLEFSEVIQQQVNF